MRQTQKRRGGKEEVCARSIRRRIYLLRGAELQSGRPKLKPCSVNAGPAARTPDDNVGTSMCLLLGGYGFFRARTTMILVLNKMKTLVARETPDI